VVNQALASALLDDSAVIGQFLSCEEGMPADIRIVGIVADAEAGPRDNTSLTIYHPCFQRPGPAEMNVVVRISDGETPSFYSVMSVIRRRDP
jgi:hypothetical protein